MPRFANTLGSHMVLQRAPQRLIVWGFGDPSTTEYFREHIIIETL